MASFYKKNLSHKVDCKTLVTQLLTCVSVTLVVAFWGVGNLWWRWSSHHPRAKVTTIHLDTAIRYVVDNTTSTLCPARSSSFSTCRNAKTPLSLLEVPLLGTVHDEYRSVLEFIWASGASHDFLSSRNVQRPAKPRRQPTQAHSATSFYQRSNTGARGWYRKVGVDILLVLKLDEVRTFSRNKWLVFGDSNKDLGDFLIWRLYYFRITWSEIDLPQKQDAINKSLRATGVLSCGSGTCYFGTESTGTRIRTSGSTSRISGHHSRSQNIKFHKETRLLAKST